MVYTVKRALSEIRATGCTASRTEHGEFRINHPKGIEETAAYDSDPESAVGTARAIAAWWLARGRDLTQG